MYTGLCLVSLLLATLTSIWPAQGTPRRLLQIATGLNLLAAACWLVLTMLPG